MRITVISGGEPGAHFVRRLHEHLDRTAELAGAEVTVIANTGEDISLWGLRLCPDLDRLVEALSRTKGTPPHPAQTVTEGLGELGLTPDWYPATDAEMAVHIARTAWLARGESLSEVTERIARGRRVPDTVRVLPMSDVPVETHAVVDDGEDQQAVHVQQWRRELGGPQVARFVVAGLDRAAAAPGVLDAIREADVVLLPPSDPVLALGILLGVPGVRGALRGTSAPVVGVSPVVDGQPVPDGIATSLASVGVEQTATGVKSLLSDLLDGWVVDPGEDPAATALAQALSLRS